MLLILHHQGNANEKSDEMPPHIYWEGPNLDHHHQTLARVRSSSSAHSLLVGLRRRHSKMWPVSVCSRFVHNSQISETTMVSFSRKQAWMNKLWPIQTMGHYLVLKRNELTIHDKTGKMYVHIPK